MSQRGKRERLGKQILTVLLTLAMIVSLTPSLGALTGGALGAQEAYATEGISGSVNASSLTMMGEYTLTDNTTIYIDTSKIIGSINIGNYTLTIEGNGDDILSIYGRGIEGYEGNIILKSGRLEVETGVGDGNWIAAVDLTQGGFTMKGGGLRINYTANGRDSSYGINAKSFTMTGGTANVMCKTQTSGNAVGIAVDNFTMTGGDLDVQAETTVSDKSAYGIEASGATSDADFHMSGGTLGATGTAGSEGYGIDWTGDKTKNSFVIDGGKLTAEGVKKGISSWVPVTISGGADVTVRSTDGPALYAYEATIKIRGVGTKVTAESTTADAIDAYKATIEIVSGVKILQPENGYVATYGGDSQSIKNASDEWAKKVVIEGVSREEISQIIATSNNPTPVYGEPIPYPEITVTDGSPAYFSSAQWLKKTDEDWEEVSGGTFTEGTYIISGMIRIDQGGTEYILGWPLTVKVDGVEWTSEWDGPEVYDTYSRIGIGSPEYVVTAPPDPPLVFNDKSSYDIGTTYIGEAISDYSVASSAEGGKKPYVFSKISGPSWISVSGDGIVSGTPSKVGSNEDLVVRVTDDKGDYKEITISVAQTTINPADRTAITEIVATSNITTPVYGAAIPVPEITVQYGAPAYFSSAAWYKKNGDDWDEVAGGTFTEGTYHCSAMIRIDEGGTEYMLGWPLSVTVDGVEWTTGWDGPEVYDTYSRLGIGSPEYVVEKCPSGGGHDWQIVNHKASFTADGYQSMECSKCGKQHDGGIAIGALKVNTVKLEKTSYVYTGKAIKPAVTLSSADGPLSKEYYTVSYSDNIKAGTAKVKITLKGDYYEGTKTLTFKITPVPLGTVKLSKTAYTWSGAQKKPTATVTAKVNGTAKTLTEGTDYTVTIKNSSGKTVSSPKKVDQYKVYIKGKGNYSGTATKTFKINPKGTTLKAASNYTVGKTKVTVKWNTQSTKMSTARITGYQVQMATNKSFTTGKKTAKVAGYTKASKQFTKLTKNKTYYVRIRTYKEVKVDGKTKTLYSPWSTVKTVKTKK